PCLRRSCSGRGVRAPRMRGRACDGGAPDRRALCGGAARSEPTAAVWRLRLTGTMERTMRHAVTLAIVPAALWLPGAGLAQQPPEARPPPAPASTAMTNPAMTGPIAANANPLKVEAGPLGNLYVTGALSALAFGQSNPFPGDHDGRIDISNGQVMLQKPEGEL